MSQLPFYLFFPVAKTSLQSCHIPVLPMYVLLPVFLLVRLLAICFFVLYITVSMYMID